MADAAGRATAAGVLATLLRHPAAWQSQAGSTGSAGLSQQGGLRVSVIYFLVPQAVRTSATLVLLLVPAWQPDSVSVWRKHSSFQDA